jgi:hypothetical protein
MKSYQTVTQDQLEIIASAAERLSMMAGAAGSGRYPDDPTTSTICALTTKAAELASRHAEAKNTGEHHAFAAHAHDLAMHARALAGEVDEPDSTRRYHGDAAENHSNVAKALGYREPSPTLRDTSVGSPA